MADLFQGKIAIVTGGASGIGHALCAALAKHGAHVIVADIDRARAEHLASALTAAGHRASAAAVDVVNLEQVRQLVSGAVASHGRLDYMFNNAAATATRGEIHGLPVEPWKRAFDVNTMGVVNGTIAAYDVMVKQGHGHIVNTGSLAGLVGFPTSIPYGASKAAVVNLSVSLRVEAAGRGVNVSVVCPGPVHGGEGLMGVHRAAELFLKGVRRNRSIIVFPFSARVLWWISRLCPDLLFRLGENYVRKVRLKKPEGR